MNTQSLLVAYARMIAVYVGYVNLEYGLQPAGVLHEKLAHEKQEFAEAQATKTPLHVLHEAADILYYSACLDAHEEARCHDTDDPRIIPLVSYWQRAYAYLESRGVNVAHAKSAALAKYGWRSSAPGHKDEAYELSLIAKAIE